MNVTWDGRCTSCGQKISTGGCTNLGCPVGGRFTFVFPSVFGSCRCGQLEKRVEELEAEVRRLKGQLAVSMTHAQLTSIMPPGFTTTDRW